MRAWRVQEYGEPRAALRCVEMGEPQPGPGELRLRVRAAAIGLPDVFLCRGTYAYRPPLPFVPGQEVCGVVDAAGEGVDIVPGTRLMGVTSFVDGRGGFAEATIVPARSAFRVPDSMPDTEAAGFRIGFSTAWVALVRRGQLAAGERLAVLGAAGGSGAAAVQVGHALGAHVIAVTSGGGRAGLCRRLGADVVLDRTAGPVPDALLEATRGRGVDVIFDPVGGDFAIEAYRGLAPRGRFLAVGFASGQWVRLSTHDLVVRNQSLVGVIAGGLTAEEGQADHERLLEIVGRRGEPASVTTVPFDGLPAAVEAVAAGTVAGKLVVAVSLSPGRGRAGC